MSGVLEEKNFPYPVDEKMLSRVRSSFIHRNVVNYHLDYLLD